MPYALMAFFSRRYSGGMAAPREWTTGPAKWAAVAVLGAASVGGLGWSIFNRERGGLAVLPRETVGATEAAMVPSSSTARLALPWRSRPRSLTPGHRPQHRDGRGAGPLAGVGPAMAARIIDYRTQHGPFASVDQLDNVKGVGPRMMEKLRPLVKVEPAARRCRPCCRVDAISMS